jgi:glyceraldehyde 3-phosphate dehydrogenase
MLNKYETELSHWVEKEKKAIELAHVVGKLWFDRSIELVFFRKPLFDIGSSEVLARHQSAKQIVGQDISIFETHALAQAIAKSNLAPSRIDIGKLASEWLNSNSTISTVDDFIIQKLGHHIGKDKINLRPRDVVLYGFGRIGRIAARELISQAGKGEQLRLRAIVTRNYSNEELTKRAELLRNDSVHGAFSGTVIEDFENRALIVNGQMIFLLAAKSLQEIDYTPYGISNAIIIDNTGIVRDREGLSLHLKSLGVEKVLLTAPGKGDVPNIVFGVNHVGLNPEEKIVSAASCTTNAIVPVLKVIEDQLGIEKGHIETVHSYTNDQNLLDNYHKKYRRGRSAALNMVITETGSSKAVAKVIPGLEGKLTGNAVRVPTPNVSLGILNLALVKKTSKEELEKILKDVSLSGELVEQIEYSKSNELVSSDLIGNSHAAIIDGPATIVSDDGKSIVLYIWYDNEYGYTRQVIRLAKSIAQVGRLVYY